MLRDWSINPNHLILTPPHPALRVKSTILTTQPPTPNESRLRRAKHLRPFPSVVLPDQKSLNQGVIMNYIP